MVVRALPFALVALSVALSLPAQENSTGSIPRRLPSEMPKTVSSADGFIEVTAADVPGDPVGFRLPILQFATKIKRDLERAYRLEMPEGARGISIYALGGRTNDTRVVTRRSSGAYCRIWLPSPGYSDIETLRFEIAKAFFFSWIARRSGKARPSELPDWLVQGLLRATDGAVAHDDTRFVLELWSNARLPFFPALCTDLRVAKGPAAALPGYVAAWMKEKKLVVQLLERLAGGEPWDGEWLAGRLTGEKDATMQDRASDERLARLSRAVLSPGRASAWDVKVFGSRLLLYPAAFDMPLGKESDSCTFREAAEIAHVSEAVRDAAWRKAREMPFCVIGRGDAMIEAGNAYRAFLLAAAKGGSPMVLNPLLSAAEAKFAALAETLRNGDGQP